jgi:hypothetical protein
MGVRSVICVASRCINRLVRHSYPNVNIGNKSTAPNAVMSTRENVYLSLAGYKFSAKIYCFSFRNQQIYYVKLKLVGR